MDKHQLIKYCLNLDDTIETYPFDEVATVLKHNNKKTNYLL